ncbi:MAG TPA: XRE family transcriptional regulator [Lacipirellulaceae bacterium]|nr:XRE family transcriptional regulator [Lacipirellulaceae bacterium]HMP04950.1 XRE family transcriptional regulator [Lacipirellulaceae bacterium]
MNKFNPDMLILAREYRGMSQTALAEALSITQATVSRYESGLIQPTPEHITKMASKLDRPEGFFFLDQRLYNASCMYHRKRKSLSVRDEKRVHAQVNELRIHATILLADAEIESRFSFHRLDMAKLGPEGAAQMMRRMWQLPTGCVRSVVECLESAGAVVFRCPFGTPKVDGISQWPLDNPSMPPVFFVNDAVPGDRQRWTLSHELGHIVMHHMPTDDPEDEADRFAAEFLMPAREIGSELVGLTLQKAASLKSCWKVSMAAIIRHAYRLKKISERQYRYLNMELSKRGYKKCEPVPIPPEEPQLLREVLDVHRRAHNRGAKYLSDLLQMKEDRFRDEYWRGMSGLRIAM